MAKRKIKKLGKLFISPDGGETVYEQLTNGDRKLVSKTQLAQDIEKGKTEEEMVGPVAIELRRKYPALQKAWNKYLTVWHLINGND
jgi:hypothetical protein